MLTSISTKKSCVNLIEQHLNIGFTVAHHGVTRALDEDGMGWDGMGWDGINHLTSLYTTGTAAG
jgi:hypothetical protein